MQDKPVIDFGTVVDPGGTEKVSHTFDSSGFITHLHARAYPGEERAVSREFLLWRGGKDNGNPIPIVRRAADSQDGLRGDNETWDFSMRREFSQNDVLEAVYRNDGSFSYPMSTVMAVDHDRGLIEKLGGLL